MSRQITDLPEATGIVLTDLFLLRNGAVSKQLTYNVLKTAIEALVDAGDFLPSTTNINNNSNADLDTFLADGRFYILDAISTEGLPDGVGASNQLYLDVTSINSTNTSFQTLRSVTSSELWVRSIVTGVIGAWSRVFTETDNPLTPLYVTGGGVLSLNKTYLIGDTNTYTLPLTTGLSTTSGNFVACKKFAGVDPTIQVDGTETETINWYELDGVTLRAPADTSLTYNIFTPLEFIFNTNWEL
jgi:hypothetical protein